MLLVTIAASGRYTAAKEQATEICEHCFPREGAELYFLQEPWEMLLAGQGGSQCYLWGSGGKGQSGAAQGQSGATHRDEPCLEDV